MEQNLRLLVWGAAPIARGCSNSHQKLQQKQDRLKEGDFFIFFLQTKIAVKNLLPFRRKPPPHPPPPSFSSVLSVSPPVQLCLYLFIYSILFG